MSISKEIFKSKSAYVARNEDVAVNMQELMDEQIEVILNHRATNHPFLNDYARNGASPEASKILYLETLHYFKYLPFYVCGISTITRDEAVLRAITFNARDELGQTKSHSDIYYEFLLKKGISEREIEEYECLPSTRWAIRRRSHVRINGSKVQRRSDQGRPGTARARILDAAHGS